MNIYLKKTYLSNLRNIQHLEIEWAPRWNGFVGNNGSGKTTILEGIHFLSLGRSFRSFSHQPLLRYGESLLQLRGDLSSNQAIAIQKNKNKPSIININKMPVESVAELAMLFPLQIVYADTIELLESGPNFRRQFMDWGMFHVKQSFLTTWRQLQRLLKQRNAALRHHLPMDQIILWDETFVSLAQELDAYRSEYCAALFPLFHSITSAFGFSDVSIEYYRGWSDDFNLSEILTNQLNYDCQQGYTHSGPQAADLFLTKANLPIHKTLSRGQLKMIIFALRIAQGLLLHQKMEKNCILLLDDVAAELDKRHRALLKEQLLMWPGQIFFTGVEKEVIEEFINIDSESAIFEVKQGEIKV